MQSKTILITGANRGIGNHAAKKLAEQGHRVILTGRNIDHVTKAAKEIGVHATPKELDVTNPNSIAQFTQWLSTQKLKIDVLINNAGSVFDQWEAPQDSGPLYSDVSVLRQTLELNLIAPYALTRALFPFFANQSRVDIINISSGMGSIHEMGTGMPTYRISKTALNGLTAYLNASAPANIYINSVCPGWVRTELGGPGAPRSLDEGVEGILWVVNESPEIRGKFIRDRMIIQY